TRGKERVERTIKLAGELPPYRHAFLGILPVRPPVEPPAAAEGKATADNDKKESGTKSDAADKAAAVDKKKAESTEKGVAVRFVYEGSPGGEAGIQIGDRITQINESKVDSIDDAIAAVNNLASGNKITVKLIRDGQPKDVEVTVTKLPTNVPSELP